MADGLPNRSANGVGSTCLLVQIHKNHNAFFAADNSLSLKNLHFLSIFPHSAFKDDRFTGRPKNLQTIMTAFFASSNKGLNSNGIVFSHGHMWQEQRRFALRTLRDQVLKRALINDATQLCTQAKQTRF